MAEFSIAIPKLPMRNVQVTKQFQVHHLEFEIIGDYGNHILLEKDSVEIRFFEFSNLKPLENYGQIYVCLSAIETFYKRLNDNKVSVHPNGKLELKSWGQLEFSILDPDHDLITFGESR